MWRKQSRMMSLPPWGRGAGIAQGLVLVLLSSPSSLLQPHAPDPSDTSQAATYTLSLLVRIVFPFPGPRTPLFP